ncbi:MAG: UbiA family prenyltransferase [Chloroflexia bacterium]|nr:UbiA family prenyltransferase [Chloroflexia bacterium]
MLKTILELNKIKIVSAVTLTTLLGYVMASGSFSTGAILPVLGVWLLAGGSAVLNQYQEKETDKLMVRTKNRPIPSGRVTERFVLFLIIFEVLLGSTLLYLGSNFLGLQLGLLALFLVSRCIYSIKKENCLCGCSRSINWCIASCCWLGCGRWKSK